MRIIEGLKTLEARWNAEGSGHEGFEQIADAAAINIGPLQRGEWLASVPSSTTWSRSDRLVGRTLRLFRLKRRQPQIYPLVPSVAEALARYIDTVRPPSSCPEVFLCMQAPRRPLKAGSIYDVANRRFVGLGIDAAHRGGQPRGYAAFSPLPTSLPKLPPQQTPYAYSTEELRRLLAATSILKDGHSPQVPTIYRTLLLLLYGSGMRIGEALGLVLHDVELSEQIITVRDTKFFKTRLVPIGPKLNCELAAHIERRRLLPLPRGEESPLFTTRDGRP